MLTKIIYNCDPESLGEVTESEFAEAMENQVRSVPSFGELEFQVTFKPTISSGVQSWASDDFDADSDLENTFRERFERIADAAWNFCIKNSA